MTKTLLTSLSVLSLLMSAVQAEEPMKQRVGMIHSAKAGHATYHKAMRKKKHTPFLITHGLPHLSRMIMPYMDDPAFNLTQEQKTKLTEIRKETMGVLMKIKPAVQALKKEIVQGSMSGVDSDILKNRVEKLASLEAEATVIQLKCIEKTKEVLTKDQLFFLLSNKNRLKKHRVHKRVERKKGVAPVLHPHHI